VPYYQYLSSKHSFGVQIFNFAKVQLGIKPVEDISSAIVGLTVIALAITLMVVGSLLFPDRSKHKE
jgi:hypothetical protein